MGLFKNIINSAVNSVVDEFKKEVDNKKESLKNKALNNSLYGSIVKGIASDSKTDTYEDEINDENQKSQFSVIGTIVTFTEGIEEIDQDAMCDFPSNVTKIIFPSTLESISEGDFASPMRELVELDFSKADKLTSIEDDAFHDCPKLQVIVFPKNLKEIPKFKNCDNIREIHCGPELSTFYDFNGESHKIDAYISCKDADYEEDFVYNCKHIYIHRNCVKDWRESANDDDETDVMIDRLPDGYSFSDQYSTQKTKDTERHTHIVASPEQETIPTQNSPVAPATTKCPPPVAHSTPAACPPPVPEFKYHAVIEGKQRGPYNREQFSRLVDAGLVNGDTLVWSENMSGWEKAITRDDMKQFFMSSMPPSMPQGNGGCPPPPPIG